MIARLLQHGIENRFAQNHPRESDPFASRRVATRPSRTQALRWMGRYG